MDGHSIQILILVGLILIVGRAIVNLIRKLPDAIAEKVIEKLREAEKRKQAEQKNEQ